MGSQKPLESDMYPVVSFSLPFSNEEKPNKKEKKEKKKKTHKN
jgi:hypothetical protein